MFLDKIYGKEYFMELAVGGGDCNRKLKEHPEYYTAAATKACRTAVMIGDILQYKEMKNIVSELSGLGSPWNCPHGRPTLIYLCERDQI